MWALEHFFVEISYKTEKGNLWKRKSQLFSVKLSLTSLWNVCKQIHFTRELRNFRWGVFLNRFSLNYPKFKRKIIFENLILRKVDENNF